MDSQDRIQDFLQVCANMTHKIHEGGPLTDLEIFLLRTHVRNLIDLLDRQPFRSIPECARYLSD